MIKVVGGYRLDSFKNCFFNLAIPVVVLTEPAAVKQTLIRLEHFHGYQFYSSGELVKCRL